MTRVTNNQKAQGRRTVTVLGSTGSIGLSTVDVLLRERDAYDIMALTAHSRVDALIEQALHVRPRRAVIGDERHYGRLREGLAGSGIEAAAGSDAVVEAACMDAEWVMAAIVGATALRPVMAAVQRGCTLALANKETLVCAGHLILEAARRHGTTIIPVDSEHSAIFQVFEQEHIDSIDKIILTASGGPFWNCRQAELVRVTPRQALAHPNWDMGAKISIDSATMMNKGLEFIEACQLFPVAQSQIEVVIHPQSIVHSGVCYKDGSFLAQMGVPDMRTPISYALGWPRRMDSPVKTLDLTDITTLTFHKTDDSKFPSLALARQCQQQGGSAPIILNAANEVAVEAFLQERIGFCDIFAVVEETLADSTSNKPTTLEDVFACDEKARQDARAWVTHKNTHMRASVVGG
ncbi:MAG: 1-deoxy-D-xylulose-5-phosphate reductoisomerase [Alphaproteobacteria bacterium GM202ARS2]|nr:1-deoxy-D-xylulose-5-phosphate reductoisomerase [Alphaproteobacteria bacterium GM202ARS2]